MMYRYSQGERSAQAIRNTWHVFCTLPRLIIFKMLVQHLFNGSEMKFISYK